MVLKLLPQNGKQYIQVALSYEIWYSVLTILFETVIKTENVTIKKYEKMAPEAYEIRKAIFMDEQGF